MAWRYQGPPPPQEGSRRAESRGPAFLPFTSTCDAQFRSAPRGPTRTPHRAGGELALRPSHGCILPEGSFSAFLPLLLSF